MLHRWSGVIIRRARLVLALGILATIFAGVFGVGVFDKLGQGGFDDPASEASTELEQERDAFGNKSADVIAIYRSDDLTVTDPAFKAEVDETLAEIPDGTTTSVMTYWDTRDPSMVSTDKHATTVTVSLAGDDQAEMADINDKVVPALESDELETDIAGPWAVYKGVNETVSEDLARAETLSLPLVIILSLLIFGSVVASLMPAVVGAIAVLGALAVVRMITGFTEVSVFSINVITLLGTGLAIDYALFVVSRFREELAQLPEDDPEASAKAIRVTMATAGRTVLFSGLTVAAAMSSLLIFPQNFLRSLGYGGIAAVIVAVIAATTVLPAILDAPRPPHRRRPAAVAPAPPRLGRERPRRLGAPGHGRDAPPPRGDGHRGDRAPGDRRALPRREVGLGRLPGAATRQPGPRGGGEAEHRVRPGAFERQPPAREHRPGRRGGVHRRGEGRRGRGRRTHRGAGREHHAAARVVGGQQPDPGVPGHGPRRSARSPARTGRTSSWAVSRRTPSTCSPRWRATCRGWR